MNILGTNCNLFSYYAVRPKAPIIEEWESVGHRTMDLRYELDRHLHLFPPGLKQDAQYRSVSLLNHSRDTLSVCIANLALCLYIIGRNSP